MLSKTFMSRIPPYPVLRRCARNAAITLLLSIRVLVVAIAFGLPGLLNYTNACLIKVAVMYQVS